MQASFDINKILSGPAAEWSPKPAPRPSALRRAWAWSCAHPTASNRICYCLAAMMMIAAAGDRWGAAYVEHAALPVGLAIFSLVMAIKSSRRQKAARIAAAERRALLEELQIAALRQQIHAGQE